MPYECSGSIALGPLTLEHVDSLLGASQATDASEGNGGYHLLFNHGVPRQLPGPAHRTLNTHEAVVLDEAMFSRFAITQSTGLMHWVLPADWMHDIISSPRHLLGNPMRAPCKWSVALNAFLSQLSADVIRAGPVTPARLAVQIGTLLALIAESAQKDKRQTPLHPDLHDQARTRIAERCCDVDINAADVARSLGISSRTLHRSLAHHGKTFGELLMASRIQLSERMLSSPNLRRLSIAEIGRRAGFKDPSHFAKVFRRLRGISPTEAQHLATIELKQAGR